MRNTLKEKLEATIKTAKKFDLRIYLAYQNNKLVKSFPAFGMDQAFNKLKFSYPAAYIHIELMELKNKETLNSPEVFNIVKELFPKDMTI